jgi:hypothetical protein
MASVIASNLMPSWRDHTDMQVIKTISGCLHCFAGQPDFEFNFADPKASHRLQGEEIRMSTARQHRRH